jgi:hypothetical protein
MIEIPDYKPIKFSPEAVKGMSEAAESINRVAAAWGRRQQHSPPSKPKDKTRAQLLAEMRLEVLIRSRSEGAAIRTRLLDQPFAATDKPGEVSATMVRSFRLREMRDWLGHLSDYANHAGSISKTLRTKLPKVPTTGVSSARLLAVLDDALSLLDSEIGRLRKAAERS